MKKTIIITGYFGSGKSEFALNLALKYNSEHHDVVLADLDIINPYFRSVETRSFLEEKGIEVVSTSFDGQMDLPAVPGRVFSLFNHQDKVVILDLGGDEEGARILGYLAQQLNEEPFELWCCINANRAETSTVEKAIEVIDRIEQSSKQKITGLVNTTHLLQYTTIEDIERGKQLVKELVPILGIDFIYNVVHHSLINQASHLDKVFEIETYLKKPWEV